MVNVEAHFVKNIQTLDEVFIFEPPSDLVLGPDEILITKSIPEEDFNNLKDPNYERFRLYSYVKFSAKNKEVSAVDFKKETSERFFEDKEYIYGRLIRTTYYPYDNGSPDMSMPILKEEVDYTFNDLEVVDELRRVYSYWRNSGSQSTEKVVIKNLSRSEMVNEGETRRRVLVDKMIYDATQALVDEGSILAVAKDDMNNFLAIRQGGIDGLILRDDTSFIDDIAADTLDPFLQQELATKNNKTMKTYILDIIDYPTAETMAPNLGSLYKGSSL